MPTFRSNYLNTFSQMHKTSPKETRDILWRGLENPTIEDIPDQTDKLVTFLYQLGALFPNPYPFGIFQNLG